MSTERVRREIAQMVMPRIDGPRLEESAYREEILALAREGMGGFILFGGDIESTPRRLAEVQAAAEIPLLISSDVERGLGQQLAGGTRFPSQRAVAAAINRKSAKDRELLNAMLDAVRGETRAAGIHVVFSPVMDVNNNPDNPIICTRAFGEDPETVEWFGRQYISRLQKPRDGKTLDLLACAKHFPGHGDTDQDSHTLLPVIRADKGRLNRVELPPFREAVKDGVGMVMIAHLLVPALDPEKPVTFSKKIVTALLREGMEFDGLIISDALDMGALANDYPQGEIALRAVEAGMDILLHPRDVRAVIDAVAGAVAEGRVTEERVLESVARIKAAKKRLGLLNAAAPAASKIDYEKHRAIAAELGEKALTVLRGEGKKFSASAAAGTACFILDDDAQGRGEAFSRELTARLGSVTTAVLTPATGAANVAATHAAALPAGAVVFAVFSRISASKGRSGMAPQLRDAAFSILRAARAAGTPTAVVSFDSPYLLDQFTDADILIAGYDRIDAIQRAAAKLLAG